MYRLWSTTEIEPHRRRDFLNDAVSESYLLMSQDIDAAAARAMRFTVEHKSVDRLRLNRCHGDVDVRNVRTSSHIARQPEDVILLNINLGQTQRLRHNGLDRDCQPGEVVLLSGASPLETLSNGANSVTLTIPTSVIDKDVDHMRSFVAQPLRPSAPLAMLRAQVVALAQWSADIPVGQSGVIADSLISLLRCALLDGTHLQTPTGGLHLVRRIQALIAEAYTDPTLTPLRAAHDLGVSVRTLHDGLARDGETFMSLLMSHRLRCARSLLMSNCGKMPIAALSQRCGFRSASHFTRLFRERFGQTPSAIAFAAKDTAGMQRMA